MKKIGTYSWRVSKSNDGTAWKVELNINRLKTKTMVNKTATLAHTDDTCVKTVRSYLYLGQIITMQSKINLKISPRTKLVRLVQ